MSMEELPPRDSLAWTVLCYFSVRRYVGDHVVGSGGEMAIRAKLGVHTEDEWNELLRRVMVIERG